MRRRESIYFEEIMGQMGKDVCRKLFTDAVFIINKKCKQNTHKWGQGLLMVHPYNGVMHGHYKPCYGSVFIVKQHPWDRDEWKGAIIK